MIKTAFTSMMIAALLNIPMDFLPKVSLLAVMFGAMAADFCTGVIKAYILKQKITEQALTKTVIKFCQYGGAILIGLGISYMSMLVGEYNDTWKYTPKFMSFCNNSLLIFIINIEIRSIIRNLIQMDTKSQMSKTLLAPALKVLSIKIRNNPVTKLTIETDDDVDVEQRTIQSKNIIK